MKTPTPQAAFTLVEVLAALLFLAVAIPALTAAFNGSNRAGSAAERTALAGRLAQNQLGDTIMRQMAADSGASTSPSLESGGNFGGQYPGFRWEMREESWPLDSTMQQYTVQVFFPVGGKERSVELSTLYRSLTASAGASAGSTP